MSTSVRAAVTGAGFKWSLRGLMKITECVPLAGRGLVARRGHRVAPTRGTDAGPDPLLSALTAVACANGDGAALVLVDGSPEAQVTASGIVLTIEQGKPGSLIPNDPHAPAAATMRPAMEQAVASPPPSAYLMTPD